jgi:hypothetical protein
MNDPGERLRDAAFQLTVPPFPAARIAQRLASPRAPVRGAGGWAPLRAVALSGAIVVAAFAAAPPSRQVMSDAMVRTIERLTGQRVREVRPGEALPRSAHVHTRFPVVVPRGFEITDTLATDNGATLTIHDRKLGVVMLQERWATIPPSKLEGIGIHEDGSIRRFNVRRWTIGKIAFSVTMFDPHYHDIAERIERATRAASR